MMNENATKKLMLIDGHSILNRAFYGVPDLTNAKGQHINALYGFLNILFKLLDEEKPQALAVAFDLSAPTFRHKAYDGYKGTRKPMPEELREQVPLMKEIIHAMGILIVEKEGYEADDVLGTLARHGEKEGYEVSLVSGDRDLLQIASDHIKIRIPKTKGGKTEIEDYYAADVTATYQVTPQQFIELKALMGDTADNIPGVPKVGQKTATDLMVTYGSMDGIYAHLEEISKNAIRESLRENRPLAELSLMLATICTDAPVEVTVADAVLGDIYTTEAYQLLRTLGMRKILERFDKYYAAHGGADDSSGHRVNEEDFVYHIIDNPADFNVLLSNALTADILALQPMVEKVGEAGASQEALYGFALCMQDGEAYVVPQSQALPQEMLTASIKELAKANCDNGKTLLVFDVKKYYGLLDIQPWDGLLDIKLLAYLLDPNHKEFELSTVAECMDAFYVSEYRQVFGKQTLSDMIFKLDQADYLCQLGGTDIAEIKEQLGRFYGNEVIALWQCADLYTKVRAAGMEEIYKTMELPLTRVLYDMEQAGVLVQRDALEAYSHMLGEQVEALTGSIYDKAGETFNLNSPKQLGEVLFEHMGLPGGKKTKTGYSTSADVLEKMAGEHPIVRDILTYRMLSKLKSTYADGLQGEIGADGRIHTTYKQMVTATGRLSSTEPNLQNIPMRTEVGRQIRQVFVARKGCVLVDADYSQIELRILAHLTKDPALLEAYQQGMDIHTSTAARVFHVPFDQVTDLQRRRAKAVNFGIVYGISAHGLSEDLDISRKEAESYMQEYFATYPRVQQYQADTVEQAKKDGYTTTLYGRRRPIPELKASAYMVRQFGERAAMNAPIQGTAADIMKLAMIKVAEGLAQANCKSKMILQVHDELVIEAYEEELDTVCQILREGMEQAADLLVPLDVDLKHGADWLEAH